MATYADLAPCPYFHPQWAEQIRTVGRLGRELPYARGAVGARFLSELDDLLARNWFPFRYKGWHTCELCVAMGRRDPVEASTARGPAARDGGNLLVPGRDFLYAAPTMIRHYIMDHGYAPPDEFIEAVHRCPPMASDEYFAARRTNAPRSLVEVWDAGWFV
jgi:hypothetical protein